MNPLKAILYIFGVIVTVIIISAFILSFTNLNAAAIEAGIPPSLSWLFPLNLDLFLVAASLFILYGNLSNESTRLGWGVLIIFTGVSTAFNMAHSPIDSMSRLSHAVSPIALCISMELLMLILHYTIKSGKMEPPIIPVSDHVVDIPDIKMEIPDEIPIPVKKSTKGEMIIQFFTDNPDSTVEDCYNQFGFSRTTIIKYRNQIDNHVTGQSN